MEYGLDVYQKLLFDEYLPIAANISIDIFASLEVRKKAITLLNGVTDGIYVFRLNGIEFSLLEGFYVTICAVKSLHGKEIAIEDAAELSDMDEAVLTPFIERDDFFPLAGT